MGPPRSSFLQFDGAAADEEGVSSRSTSLSPAELWKGLRLGHKVALAAVVACLPMAVLGNLVWTTSSNFQREQIERNLALASQLQADNVANRVESAADRLAEMAEHDSLHFAVGLHQDPGAASQDALASFLRQQWEQVDASSGLAGLAIVDSSGETVAVAGQPVDPTALALWRTMPPVSNSLVGSAVVVDGEARMAAVRRVRPDEGGLDVFLIGEWRLETLVGELAELVDLAPSAEATLLQQEAIGSYLVLAASGRSFPGMEVPVVAVPSNGLAMVETTTDPDGIDVVQSLAVIEGTDWVYRVAADEAEVYAALWALRDRVAQVFVIGGAALVLVLILVLRTFSTRLSRIAKLAQSVAAGDLGVRLDDDSRDEIGQLSAAFDKMTSALSTDIERREAVEAQLAYQATHDPLTGLPNRAEMMKHLQTVMAGNTSTVSVLFVDLDGFKEVNDTMGHDAGDTLLVSVAGRLRSSLRSVDFVARLGGDEFVIVLPDTLPEAAERMATQIVATLELPFSVRDEQATISASIGVASSFERGDTDELIRQADIAMYRAKSLGKGRAMRVTAEALAELEQRTATQSALRAALSDGDLELLWEPVASLGDGSLVGLQVAVQWEHPSLGLLDPAEFRAMAADIGFAGRADDWVVRESIRRLAGWRRSGQMVTDLQLTIPLTPSTFVSPRYRTLVADAVETHDVPSAAVRVAVDERVLQKEEAVLREVFGFYRRSGISVELARFGSDYANLEQLALFGLDSVQIDVKRLETSLDAGTSRASLGSLVHLADAAGLRVVMVGVDSEELRGEALSLGGREGRGRWISPQLDRAEVERLLANRFLVEF